MKILLLLLSYFISATIVDIPSKIKDEWLDIPLLSECNFLDEARCSEWFKLVRKTIYRAVATKIRNIPLFNDSDTKWVECNKKTLIEAAVFHHFSHLSDALGIIGDDTFIGEVNEMTIKAIYTTIPLDITDPSTVSYTNLSFRGAPLTRIPVEIFPFFNSFRIDLRRTGIDDAMFEDLYSVKHLSGFDVSCNNLTIFPNLKRFPKLNGNINISNNPIKDLGNLMSNISVIGVRSTLDIRNISSDLDGFSVFLKNCQAVFQEVLVDDIVEPTVNDDSLMETCEISNLENIMCSAGPTVISMDNSGSLVYSTTNRQLPSASISNARQIFIRKMNQTVLMWLEESILRCQMQRTQMERLKEIRKFFQNMESHEFESLYFKPTHQSKSFQSRKNDFVNKLYNLEQIMIKNEILTDDELESVIKSMEECLELFKS